MLGDSAPRAVFLRGYVVVHITAEIPQLQFITVVDTSFVAQRQILMVQTVHLFLEIAVAVRFLTVDVSVVRGRADSQVPLWRRLSSPISAAR